VTTVSADPVDTKVARRVLIVDDNRDAADSMATLLRLLGHEVATAYSGPSGLTEAETFLPDVVFLDIGMPGMSGYEVARQLRAGHAAGGLHLLVAVTGFSQPTDLQRAEEAGFDKHLVKPADPSELMSLLQ
jgi:CheY-like chemotaxis protein